MTNPALSPDLMTLRDDALQAINASSTLPALDEARVCYLGKKGQLTELMKILGTLAPEERKARGAELNILREDITTALNARTTVLAAQAMHEKLERERVDVTLAARPRTMGRIHPIARTIEEIAAIFAPMGFSVAQGPDIETDYYNFTALNMPPDHPARQMQDTFYLPSQNDTPTLLRTQTSPVQIRTMEKAKAPIRIIAPGRTYRCDYDMTHTPMFHQVEGLVIDSTTTMAHLKGCLLDFLRAFFGIADLPLRFRPSYFPFTEPSAEIDIGCSRKGGEMKLGNYGDWLEIGGCGMVHPNVLRNGGHNPEEVQGFAFGCGIERLAMLKYGIPDLRTFFEADTRWLKHYGFVPADHV